MEAMQSRAARGLLRWTQNDLAKEAGVSQLTVRNFEAEKTSPTRATLDVIQRAFERAGVEFIGESGVCLTEISHGGKATPRLTDKPKGKRK
jgi:transcriptional regulator with XRE-family HTH domain